MFNKAAWTHVYLAAEDFFPFSPSSVLYLLPWSQVPPSKHLQIWPKLISNSAHAFAETEAPSAFLVELRTSSTTTLCNALVLKLLNWFACYLKQAKRSRLHINLHKYPRKPNSRGKTIRQVLLLKNTQIVPLQQHKADWYSLDFDLVTATEILIITQIIAPKKEWTKPASL